MSKSTFERYSNFSFTDETPTLPVTGALEIQRGEKEFYPGATATTIEIDAENVAKLNRLIITKPTDSGDLTHQKSMAEPYLLERDLVAEEAAKKEGTFEEYPDIERQKLVRKLSNLAENKKSDYELLSTYIGAFLPELRFFAVVDSPRKQLESHVIAHIYKGRSQVSQEVLEQIPETEYALMEVWENIDPTSVVSSLSYEDMQSLYEDGEYRSALSDFATKSYELFMNEGVMLDICDRRSGIRFKVPTESEKESSVRKISDLDELQEAVQDGVGIPYPRNVSYSKKGLKFFDLYPLERQSPELLKEAVPVILGYLREKNWVSLKDFIEDADLDAREQREYLYITRYLVLLELMGAEL